MQGLGSSTTSDLSNHPSKRKIGNHGVQRRPDECESSRDSTPHAPRMLRIHRALYVYTLLSIACFYIVHVSRQLLRMYALKLSDAFYSFMGVARSGGRDLAEDVGGIKLNPRELHEPPLIEASVAQNTYYTGLLQKTPHIGVIHCR